MIRSQGQEVTPAQPASNRNAEPSTVREGSPFSPLMATLSPDHIVRFGALAGNAAVGDLMSRVQRSSPPTVQRDGEPAGESHSGPMLEAVNIVNKNSTVKFKFNGRPQLRGGALEIKKVAIEVDGTNEISAPGLTSKSAPVKVGGGSQATATSQIDPKKAAADTTRARVYAGDLQARIPVLSETRIGEMLKFKVSGEATPGREAKASAGCALDTEYISGEVSFNFLQVDLAAKDPKDRFKPLTATVKLGTGTELQHTFPKALHFQGESLDLKVRVKISGAIEIGPRWEAMEGEIAKRFGKSALESYRASMVETIAREESFLAVETLSEKIAKEATQGITDSEVRSIAFSQAKQKAMEEAQARGIERTMVDVMVKEAAGNAAVKTDLTAARTAMRVAAETAARETFEVIGRAVIREAVKDALRLSVRRIGTSLLQALMLGPVDIALIALDMLAGSMIELVRAQQIKEMGMTAQLVRDNYVKGYRDGLSGKVSGGGQPAGGATPEGAALIAGAQDGASQFEAKVKDALTDRPELQSGLLTKEEIIEEVKQITASMEVPTDTILAKATPKLEQMLIDAYVQANSGFLTKLFGQDVKESKSFKQFEDMIKTNLRPGATHTTIAQLRNGVTLKLTSLDYTGENARRFRTEDGAYVVHMGGDTTKHSGWITDDGRPLEDLYPNQESGDKANQGAAGQEARMAAILDGLGVFATVTVRGGALTPQTITLSGRGADDEQFSQYVRSGNALSRPLSGFGSVHVMVAYYPTKARPGLMHIIKGQGQVSVQDRSDSDNLGRYAAELGIDPKGGNPADVIGQHFYHSKLEGAMLAAFPAPNLKG